MNKLLATLVAGFLLLAHSPKHLLLRPLQLRLPLLLQWPRPKQKPKMPRPL